MPQIRRPEFEEIRDFEEFSRYYWYRDELIRICKERGLRSDGGKTELNRVIEAWFAGERILPEKKRAGSRKPVVSELTLDTGLLACGFTFGGRFRRFFAEQTGAENFRFNVDMVASVREVRKNRDEAFTLGDLLEVYYNRKTYARYDRSALQWNRFVKDFFADEATAVFDERLKAAAALWKIVRDSDMKKEYSHELLEKYMNITDRKEL